MGYPVDKELFRQLGDLEIEDVCVRSGCRYERADKSYCLSFWGDEYLVNPERRTVSCLNPMRTDFHDYLPVFLVNYLIHIQEHDRGGEWISEKDLPGGATFFRGPHRIPTHLISSLFENDLEAFCRRCEQLSGSPLNMADKAYSFSPTSRLRIAVLYWQGDDDFPAAAKLLFDRSCTVGLSHDTLYALLVETCSRIAR